MKAMKKGARRARDSVLGRASHVLRTGGTSDYGSGIRGIGGVAAGSFDGAGGGVLDSLLTDHALQKQLRGAGSGIAFDDEGSGTADGAAEAFARDYGGRSVHLIGRLSPAANMAASAFMGVHNSSSRSSGGGYGGGGVEHRGVARVPPPEAASAPLYLLVATVGAAAAPPAVHLHTVIVDRETFSLTLRRTWAIESLSAVCLPSPDYAATHSGSSGLLRLEFDGAGPLGRADGRGFDWHVLSANSGEGVRLARLRCTWALLLLRQLEPSCLQLSRSLGPKSPGSTGGVGLLGGRLANGITLENIDAAQLELAASTHGFGSHYDFAPDPAGSRGVAVDAGGHGGQAEGGDPDSGGSPKKGGHRVAGVLDEDGRVRSRLGLELGSGLLSSGGVPLSAEDTAAVEALLNAKGWEGKDASVLEAELEARAEELERRNIETLLNWEGWESEAERSDARRFTVGNYLEGQGPSEGGDGNSDLQQALAALSAGDGRSRDQEPLPAPRESVQEFESAVGAEVAPIASLVAELEAVDAELADMQQRVGAHDAKMRRVRREVQRLEGQNNRLELEQRNANELKVCTSPVASLRLSPSSVLASSPLVRISLGSCLI